MTRRRTATIVTIGLLLGVLTACAAAPLPEPVDLAELETSPGIGDVTTIGALGDSMTLGVNACAEPGRCMAASWATGDDPAVGSIAMRVGAASGAVPETVNSAKDGGTVADAVARVDEVIAARPQLVVVLLGGNDVCDADVDGMTSVDDFRASYTALLAALSEGLPDARVLALSIPDLYHLWEVGRDDEGTRQIWDSSPSCSNLLGDAAATDAAATERRDAVAARTVELNAVIAEVCAADSACTSDGGAVFDYEFSPAEISAIDHFHPSVAGQQVIAEIAWNALVEAAP
ncbi:GDSL-type esterase/lipase family protein [Microbacterium sp. LWH7-1.2]|uniref:SGNH/GDSL hydrolase family protein n=1 Tax=Microbacterium sp. LWH7-1.2 TaxID=3135257 RepID=UPI0031390877